MTTKNDAPMIEQLCSRHYPVEIHHVAEEGGPGYYLAFLPDFGESTCSATGDTMTEAIERLSDVKREILQHFLDTGRDIPDPSKGPHEEPVLQQMPLRLPVPEEFAVLGLRAVPDPVREGFPPHAKPRHRVSEAEWSRLIAAARLPDPPACVPCDTLRRDFAREIDATILLAEGSLRKAIAADLRSLGAAHPELAAWAETLACRYARGEESP